MASQRTIDRLQREYDEMAVERRDNDKQVEELRAEADDVETKVSQLDVVGAMTEADSSSDGGTSEEERGRD
jgi:hypothetical protein